MDNPAYKSSPVRWLATWKGNLFFFGFMIIIAIAHSFWQVQHAKNIFLDHTKEHAATIAKLINLGIRNSEFSQSAFRAAVERHLMNTACIVDHFGALKLLSKKDLTYLAKQAGLTGIHIESGHGDHFQWPPRWLAEVEKMKTSWRPSETGLQHLAESNQFIMNFTRSRAPGTIILGTSSKRFKDVQRRIGMPALLNELSELPGICYVRHELSPEGMDKSTVTTDFITIDTTGEKLAETHFPVDGGKLVIGMTADCYLDKARQIWIEAVVFGTLLAFLGILFSWLLSRYQEFALNQVREYERKLAAEREDAALGRASAVIAHEIRNPLNAAGIGLQRLHAEAEELRPEHRELVRAIHKALGRTDGIVSKLHNYASSLITLQHQQVKLSKIITNVLTLYRSQIVKQAIRVDTKVEFDKAICGDADLLEEAIENLVKNAIEAQPAGGVILARITQTRNDAVLTMENEGFSATARDINKIMAPYFTTKATGTGLGLSIARRIVLSHGGCFHVEALKIGSLRVTISLPKKNTAPTIQYKQEHHANPYC